MGEEVAEAQRQGASHKAAADRAAAEAATATQQNEVLTKQLAEQRTELARSRWDRR